MVDRGDWCTSLCAGSCLSLDQDVIHSVTNPLDKVTAGLHIYGGNLTSGAPRSAWDGETLVEKALVMGGTIALLTPTTRVWFRRDVMAKEQRAGIAELVRVASAAWLPWITQEAVRY